MVIPDVNGDDGSLADSDVLTPDEPPPYGLYGGPYIDAHTGLCYGEQPSPFLQFIIILINSYFSSSSFKLTVCSFKNDYVVVTLMLFFFFY